MDNQHKTGGLFSTQAQHLKTKIIFKKSNFLLLHLKDKVWFEDSKWNVQPQASIQPGQWLVSNTSADTGGHRWQWGSRVPQTAMETPISRAMQAERNQKVQRQILLPYLRSMRHSARPSGTLLYGTNADILVWVAYRPARSIRSWSWSNKCSGGCRSSVCLPWGGKALWGLVYHLQIPDRKETWM